MGMFRIVKESVQAFIDDEALTRGAAIAFYTITSIGPASSRSALSPCCSAPSTRYCLMMGSQEFFGSGLQEIGILRFVLIRWRDHCAFSGALRRAKRYGL